MCKRGKHEIIISMIEKNLVLKNIITETFDDKYGTSLLHIASSNSQINTVKWLLESGASPMIKSSKGGNSRPYDFATGKTVEKNSDHLDLDFQIYGIINLAEYQLL